MKILDRKSTLDHVVDSIEYQPILKSMAQSAVDAAFSGPNPAVKLQRNRGADAALAQAGKRMALPLKKARKPGLLVAATVAGVAAVSAAVSSERRRAEGS